MSDFLFSLNVVLPIFLVMVLGTVLKNIGMLDEHFVKVANKFNYNVTNDNTILGVKFSIPKEVIEYIANNFASDVRQLEGAITRVFAYALMMNKGIVDLDIAIDALKDQLTDRSVYKNDVHRIQTVVC